MRESIYNYFLESEVKALSESVKRPTHTSMIFRPSTEVDARAASSLARVEVRDRAISIYGPQSDNDPESRAIVAALGRGEMHHCDADKTPIRFTYHYEGHHSRLHFNTKDYEEYHIHVTYNEKVTADELKCFVKQVRAFQRVEGMCRGEGDPCLLDGAHSKAIKQKFEERLDRKHDRRVLKRASANAEAKTDEVMRHINVVKTQFLNAATIGYSETLLRRYVLPLLQSKGVSYKSAVTAVESAIAVVKVSLNGMSSTVSSFVVNKLLLSVLSRLGLSTANCERVATLGSATIATLSDPTSLVSIASSATGAATGVAAAEVTLRLLPALPKLRVEPAVTEPEVEPAPRAVASGLRRRHRA